MGAAARALMPRKARLQALMDGVQSLEARLQRTAPITVLRVARCGHAACGCPPPAELPADALVIELGCSHLIPSVTPPEGAEQGYRSRVERQVDLGVGRGLGQERTRALIQRIQLIPR